MKNRKFGRGLPSLILMMLSALFAFPTAFGGEVVKEDHANKNSILVKNGTWGRDELRGRQVFVNGYDMPLRDFLVSYYSNDPQEQNVTHAFLLGIVDATEGREWCGYRIVKSISILEILHNGLKDISPSRHDERAAYVIADILKRRLPCKKER